MDDVFEHQYRDRSRLLADLKAALTGMGYSEADSDLLIVRIDESGLIEQKEIVVGYRDPPPLPPGTMGMWVRIPVYGKVLVFNGKKAALALCLTGASIVLADPIGTTVGVLKTLVGLDLAQLEYESGLACNFVTLFEANSPMSPEYLTTLTSEKECIRPKATCERRMNGTCVISCEQVSENLIRLEEKKAIRSTGSDQFVANVL